MTFREADSPGPTETWGAPICSSGSAPRSLGCLCSLETLSQTEVRDVSGALPSSGIGLTCLCIRRSGFYLWVLQSHCSDSNPTSFSDNVTCSINGAFQPTERGLEDSCTVKPAHTSHLDAGKPFSESLCLCFCCPLLCWLQQLPQSQVRSSLLYSVSFLGSVLIYWCLLCVHNGEATH